MSSNLPNDSRLLLRKVRITKCFDRTLLRFFFFFIAVGNQNFILNNDVITWESSVLNLPEAS